MKFIHTADIHLGAEPDAGSAYSQKRSREIWNSFQELLKLCEKEQTDLLLIAGDLFHRQPLLRELKEVDYLFAALTKTQVVLIAGNHDYIKKDSYYRTFQWSPNVHMIISEEPQKVVFKELDTAVYGFSYHSREITERRYQGMYPDGMQKYQILLAHGGDEKHIPFKVSELLELGYDYVALGHIHKPQELVPGSIAYAGSLEPTDKNDTGAHGFIKGMIGKNGCKSVFVPFASREYVHMEVETDRDMTGFSLRTAIHRKIEERGTENIYKIILTGFRDPEILFDLESMDVLGNIIEMEDRTRPAYDFQKLWNQNRDNLLGKFIESFAGCEPDSEEFEALCEGVHALMETKRG